MQTNQKLGFSVVSLLVFLVGFLCLGVRVGPEINRSMFSQFSLLVFLVGFLCWVFLAPAINGPRDAAHLKRVGDELDKLGAFILFWVLTAKNACAGA